MELWARHLFETVRPDGKKGFSRFHLLWERRVVAIEGSWEGATRLREWVYGRKKHSWQGYVKEGDSDLLEKIGIVHARLVLAGQSCSQILTAASEAANRKDFKARLMKLIR